TEYLIRDRLSFMRFLDLDLEDPVPDATTIWLFREALAQAGLIDKLFERFGQHLEAEGYIARGGQIIDTTIVSVPKQRNTKEENDAIKAGKRPEGWEKQPAKNAQKDKDARWTKRNDESFYGYKNHLGVDKAHKLIRKWDATDAAVHDSQKLDDLLDLSKRGVGGQRLPLGADRGEPEGEGLAEPYPPARCTQSSAVRAPEVGEYDAREGARPCRARIRPAAELDGRQDRAHHRHRASEIQDRHDEPRLQHPPAGSARADGSCTRLSALTGGVRVASCKGPRGRRPGVKTVPDRGLTSARALQPPAQPRQKSPKARIVRGSPKRIGSHSCAWALVWRNLAHEYHVSTGLGRRSDLIAVVPTGSVRPRLNLDRQTSTYLPWHWLLCRNGSLTILDPKQAFQ